MSFYERKRRNYNRSNKNIWKWWFKWNIKERHEEVDINYTYTYNNFNRLDKVLKNNLEYRRYEYDNIGRITKVYKEGTLYKSYNYLENNLNPYSINISGTNYDIIFGEGRLELYGNINYTYNKDGIRYKKIVNGNEIKYYYIKDKLLGEDRYDGSKIRYIYDIEGIVGARYYKANNTGSIIGIVKDTTIVGTYRYDVWGNIIDIYGNDEFININPIRYKGYYYDIETKLYYLESRYYDSEIGAFISIDDVSYLDIETIGGLNLYSYCNNNPVMYSDGDGHFPILACILGLTALVGMGLTIGGVASDNNVMTAIGLSMVAVPALISGGIAIAAGIGGATLTGVVGGVTVTAGLGTGLFATAEYQQTFTGNNWMLDAGMNEGWYNGLMLTTAALATLGTFASSFCSSFNIKSI